MSKTVFVGLSGGVDSAVSAALLQQQGYTVVGAFIKIWQPEFIECTWQQDRLDAMRVCSALGIPFRETDLSEEYKNEVVRHMLAEYAAGRTPNPDVLCNRSIKFGHFARWAYAQGADMVATGHYAQIKQEAGKYHLYRGADPEKDQSYFLHLLDQSDLSRALFPVGGMRKPAVRALANRFRLPVASKHDSQGLCFVGDVSMKEFLARYLPLHSGDVLDEHGAVIGAHDGAALYTIGERHGFTVAGSKSRYVTAIDVERNIIHVSSDREDTAHASVRIATPHWITDTPTLPLVLQAQARYREQPFTVSLEAESSGILARFTQKRTASPGQSLVFYEQDRCLGGAVINTFD